MNQPTNTMMDATQETPSSLPMNSSSTTPSMTSSSSSSHMMSSGPGPKTGMMGFINRNAKPLAAFSVLALSILAVVLIQMRLNQTTYNQSRAFVAGNCVASATVPKSNCNEICAMNADCMTNYCYSGVCRNPANPTSSTCEAPSPTPSPTSSPKVSPTPTVKPSPSPSPTVTPTPTPTPVSSCPTTSILANYNLYVSGTLNASSADVQGRVAVGGNASFTNYDLGLGLTNSNGTRDDVIGGANLSLTNTQVENGNATYVGTFTSTGSTFLHGSARKANPLNFSAETANLINTSNTWASWPANGTTKYDSVSTTLTLTGSNSKLNIFTVSTANLTNTRSFVVNVPSGSSVLININSGSSLDMHDMGISLNGTDASHVLMNMPGVTTLAIHGTSPEWSILAPKAALNSYSNAINGSVVVASVTGSGQYNNKLIMFCPALPQ